MTKVKLSADHYSESTRGMCGAGCVVEYENDEATAIIAAGKGEAVEDEAPVEKKSKRKNRGPWHSDS